MTDQTIVGSATRRRGSHPGWSTFVVGLPLVVVLCLVWQGVATFMNSLYVPTFTAALQRFVADWLSGPPTHLFLSTKLLINAGLTIERLVLGWTVGVAIGVGAGLLIARWRPLRLAATPLIRLGMSTPSPALLPIAIAFFGLGTGMKVFFIAFGTIWPVLTNTVSAIANVDSYVLNSGRSLLLGRWLYLTRVLLPAASPQIMSGIRIGSNAAILLIAVAELYASDSGIGYVIVQTQRNFDMLGTWSGMLLLCLIGVLFNALFSLVEGRIMSWHYKSRNAS